jgi:hypothetical protein
MALTADLVARVARVVEDAGLSPGAVYLTDAEYDIIIREMLAQAPPGDLWLFAQRQEFRSPCRLITARPNCGILLRPNCRKTWSIRIPGAGKYLNHSLPRIAQQNQ